MPASSCVHGQGAILLLHERLLAFGHEKAIPTAYVHSSRVLLYSGTFEAFGVDEYEYQQMLPQVIATY